MAPNNLHLPIRAEPVLVKPAYQVKTGDGSVFDLVETYNRILASDAELTMPVAAIEALVELLSHTSDVSTINEMTEIIQAQVEYLNTSVPNPIPTRTGSKLFTNEIRRLLKKQTADDGSGDAGSARLASAPNLSFDDVRRHLVRNIGSFAAQAKAARTAIADMGARYIRAKTTIMTTGGSRCVQQLLLRAAEKRTKEWGHPDFRVIYVMDGSPNSEPTVKALREHNVEVAEVDLAATAHAMRLGDVDRVFVGAEAVCQRGGVLSRMGTYQLAILAKQYKKDFYVATETHKFVHVTLLDQRDIARRNHVDQSVLNFKRSTADPTASALKADKGQWRADYTPPDLVKAFITEQGTKAPASVAEFLLRIFHNI